MANSSFDQIRDAAREVAIRSADAAGEFAEKCKNRFDCISLENELSKLQKRLGVLTYEQKVRGADNGEQIDGCCAKITDTLEKISAASEQARAEKSGAVVCPNCGASMPADAGFCSRCGTKLK